MEIFSKEFKEANSLHLEIAGRNSSIECIYQKCVENIEDIKELWSEIPGVRREKMLKHCLRPVLVKWVCVVKFQY